METETGIPNSSSSRTTLPHERSKQNVSAYSETMELLFSMAVNDAVNMFRGDMAVLLMADDRRLVMESFVGIDEESIGHRSIEIGESFSGSLTSINQPVIIEDVNSYMESIDNNREPYYSGSAMVGPLLFGGEFIGMINLCRCKNSGVFTRDDREKFEEFCNQISVSIGSQTIIDIKTAQLRAARSELNELNSKLRRQNSQLNAANRELKEASRKLALSEEHYRNVVEYANDGIVIVTGDTVRFSNTMFCEITGMSREDLEGRNFFELFHQEERKGIRNYLHRCEKEYKTGDFLETWLYDRKGKRVEIEVNCGHLKHDGEDSLLIFLHDITERKLLQMKLNQAQKLESIGQLAAGIAHEINTPTQYVGDNIRFLRDAFGDLSKVIDKYQEILEPDGGEPVKQGKSEELEELIEEIDLQFLVEDIPRAIDQSIEGVERVASIVRSMKKFSHPGSEGKTSVDINDAINSTVTVARNEYKYVSELELELDPSLPLVECVPGEFNQVILNIVLNAAHAIEDVVGDGGEEKGTITITTGTTGDLVEIRISDTGTGIPEENRDRIFDPFFTTKEVGKGTGQGLSIAKSIIEENHGGELNFETEVGEGTTFIVRLPLHFSESGGVSEK
jgi:PAS domain S-box-containing protein